MHNLPLLAKGQGKYESRCTLLLNPHDAQRHAIGDGDMVLVSSATGEITAQAEVSDEVMPGVVSLPHGWGHDQSGTRLNLASKRPGANLNALLDPNARDPLSGNSVLSGVAVTLALAQ